MLSDVRLTQLLPETDNALIFRTKHSPMFTAVKENVTRCNSVALLCVFFNTFGTVIEVSGTVSVCSYRDNGLFRGLAFKKIIQHRSYCLRVLNIAIKQRFKNS